MTTTIKSTFDLPSKDNFWLIELIGVNEKKFSGKRGELLRRYTDGSCTNYDDSYMRVKHHLHKRRFTIASINFKDGIEPNFTFKKIRKFSMSPKDISYQFDFGFGNEIYAETLEELEKKIEERLKSCKRHIENSKKSRMALEKLLKEFNRKINRKVI